MSCMIPELNNYLVKCIIFILLVYYEDTRKLVGSGNIKKSKKICHLIFSSPRIQIRNVIYFWICIFQRIQMLPCCEILNFYICSFQRIRIRYVVYFFSSTSGSVFFKGFRFPMLCIFFLEMFF